MTYTRTGSFPIGFRRGRTAWQQDLDRLIRFAKDNDFAFLDTGPLAAGDLRRITSTGVEVGTVDLKQWSDLGSPDPAKRGAAVAANEEHVRGAVGAGIRYFLAVMLAEDGSRPRRENFAYLVESWKKLMAAIEPLGARIALEGWPGPPPHFAAFAGTPADCRAVFEAIPSPALGLNFDPSHLVRMGIDSSRFLREFAGRVVHVHAKDILFLEEERYAHGNLQPATFAEPHKWGGQSWRYGLPGRGAVPWRDLIGVLAEVGYRGRISIEMEDEEFHPKPEREQQGLIQGRDFLKSL